MSTEYILLDQTEEPDGVCGIVAVVNGIARDFAICPQERKLLASALVEKLNRLDVDCIHFKNVLEDNLY